MSDSGQDYSFDFDSAGPTPSKDAAANERHLTTSATKKNEVAAESKEGGVSPAAAAASAGGKASSMTFSDSDSQPSSQSSRVSSPLHSPERTYTPSITRISSASSLSSDGRLRGDRSSAKPAGSAASSRKSSPAPVAVQSGNEPGEAVIGSEKKKEEKEDCVEKNDDAAGQNQLVEGVASGKEEVVVVVAAGAAENTTESKRETTNEIQEDRHNATVSSIDPRDLPSSSSSDSESTEARDDDESAGPKHGDNTLGNADDQRNVEKKTEDECKTSGGGGSNSNSSQHAVKTTSDVPETQEEENRQEVFAADEKKGQLEGASQNDDGNSTDADDGTTVTEGSPVKAIDVLESSNNAHAEEDTVHDDEGDGYSDDSFDNEIDNTGGSPEEPAGEKREKKDGNSQHHVESAPRGSNNSTSPRGGHTSPRRQQKESKTETKPASGLPKSRQRKQQQQQQRGGGGGGSGQSNSNRNATEKKRSQKSTGAVAAGSTGAVHSTAQQRRKSRLETIRLQELEEVERIELVFAEKKNVEMLKRSHDRRMARHTSRTQLVQAKRSDLLRRAVGHIERRLNVLVGEEARARDKILAVEQQGTENTLRWLDKRLREDVFSLHYEAGQRIKYYDKTFDAVVGRAGSERWTNTRTERYERLMIYSQFDTQLIRLKQRMFQAEAAARQQHLMSKVVATAEDDEDDDGNAQADDEAEDARDAVPATSTGKKTRDGGSAANPLKSSGAPYEAILGRGKGKQSSSRGSVAASRKETTGKGPAKPSSGSSKPAAKKEKNDSRAEEEEAAQSKTVDRETGDDKPEEQDAGEQKEGREMYEGETVEGDDPAAAAAKPQDEEAPAAATTGAKREGQVDGPGGDQESNQGAAEQKAGVSDSGAEDYESDTLEDDEDFDSNAKQSVGESQGSKQSPSSSSRRKHRRKPHEPSSDADRDGSHSKPKAKTRGGVNVNEPPSYRSGGKSFREQQEEGEQRYFQLLADVLQANEVAKRDSIGDEEASIYGVLVHMDTVGRRHIEEAKAARNAETGGEVLAKRISRQLSSVQREETTARSSVSSKECNLWFRIVKQFVKERWYLTSEGLRDQVAFKVHRHKLLNRRMKMHHPLVAGPAVATADGSGNSFAVGDEAVVEELWSKEDFSTMVPVPPPAQPADALAADQRYVNPAGRRSSRGAPRRSPFVVPNSRGESNHDINAGWYIAAAPVNEARPATTSTNSGRPATNSVASSPYHRTAARRGSELSTPASTNGGMIPMPPRGGTAGSSNRPGTCDTVTSGGKPLLVEAPWARALMLKEKQQRLDVRNEERLAFYAVEAGCRGDLRRVVGQQSGGSPEPTRAEAARHRRVHREHHLRKEVMKHLQDEEKRMARLAKGTKKMQRLLTKLDLGTAVTPGEAGSFILWSRLVDHEQGERHAIIRHERIERESLTQDLKRLEVDSNWWTIATRREVVYPEETQRSVIEQRAFLLFDSLKDSFLSQGAHFSAELRAAHRRHVETTSRGGVRRAGGYRGGQSTRKDATSDAADADAIAEENGEENAVPQDEPVPLRPVPPQRRPQNAPDQRKGRPNVRPSPYTQNLTRMNPKLNAEAGLKAARNKRRASMAQRGIQRPPPTLQTEIRGKDSKKHVGGNEGPIPTLKEHHDESSKSKTAEGRGRSSSPKQRRNEERRSPSSSSSPSRRQNQSSSVSPATKKPKESKKTTKSPQVEKSKKVAATKEKEPSTSPVSPVSSIASTVSSYHKRRESSISSFGSNSSREASPASKKTDAAAVEEEVEKPRDESRTKHETKPDESVEQGDPTSKKTEERAGASTAAENSFEYSDFSDSRSASPAGSESALSPEEHNQVDPKETDQAQSPVEQKNDTTSNQTSAAGEEEKKRSPTPTLPPMQSSSSTPRNHEVDDDDRKGEKTTVVQRDGSTEQHESSLSGSQPRHPRMSVNPEDDDSSDEDELRDTVVMQEKREEERRERERDERLASSSTTKVDDTEDTTDNNAAGSTSVVAAPVETSVTQPSAEYIESSSSSDGLGSDSD